MCCVFCFLLFLKQKNKKQETRNEEETNKKKRVVYKRGQHCSHAYSTESRHTVHLTEDCQHYSSQFFNSSPKKKSNTHNFDLAPLILGRRYTRWLVVYLFNGHVQLEIHDPNEKKEKERTKQETKNGYRILLVV